MRLFLDIDTREFLQSPSFPRALTLLALKRRDTDLIELQFVRDRVVQELPTGTTIRLGLKPANSYTAEFLATGTFTKSGTGTATKYLLDLNLNTVSLNTAFAAATPEPVTLAAMLEVEWTSGTNISSSLTLPVTIANDVIRGDEGEPVELPIFYLTETNDLQATQAEAQAGTNNTKWMSPLRTAQAISLEVAARESADTALSHELQALQSEPGIVGAYPGAAARAITLFDAGNEQTAMRIGEFEVEIPADWKPRFRAAIEAPMASELDADVAEYARTLRNAGTGGDLGFDGTTVLFNEDEFSTAPDGLAGNFRAAIAAASVSHTHTLEDLTQSAATTGQVPTWNGTAWVPETPTSGGGGVSSWNDLTDKPSTFPPDAHAHGNITTAGAIGTTSGVPIITGTGGVLQAGSFGTTAGTFAEGNHTHTGFVTASGGITSIAVVPSMPADPDESTLYIVVYTE